MRAKKFIAAISALTFLAFPFTAAPTSAAPQESVLSMSGPGNRIHGADISRWQHPGDKPIDFSKMRSAGLDFVMIKASDSRQDADLLAVKYVGGDRASAQASGIFTGFYHYAVLPDVSTNSAIIKDANAIRTAISNSLGIAQSAISRGLEPEALESATTLELE